MASVYKKKYWRTDTETGEKIQRKTKKWWIKYRDADGVVQRKPGYTDKVATRQKAANMEREAERKKAGLGDPYEEHRTHSLEEHLVEFCKFLEAKGDTEHHCNQVVRRAEQVIHGCGFIFSRDISGSRVQQFLAELRRTQPSDRRIKQEGRSAQTANHYLRAIKQFCNWMVREGRMPDNPLTSLQQFNVRMDRRHDRRAISTEEFSRLLDAARTGPAPSVP